MKARKITAIILSAMMLISMPVVVGAAEKPETNVLSLENFGEGLGSWASYVPTATTLEKIAGTGTHGGYMRVKTTSGSGPYAAYASLSRSVTKTTGFGLEYSIMIPSEKSDGSANSGRPSMMLSDNISRRNRARLVDFSMGENRVRIPDADFCYFHPDTWYNVRVELDIATGNYRITYMNDDGSVIRTGESTIESKYNASFINNGIGAVSFSEKDSGATEFYIDNARAYSFDYKDFNVGKVFVKDTMDYATMTEAYNGMWVPNTGQYAFNIANSSETRRVNCITDADDATNNKFMRVQTQSAGYIQFKKSATTYRYKSGDTDGVSALLYGAKIRIADTTKTNSMKLYITSPYVKDESGNATSSNYELCLMMLNPKDHTVTFGLSSVKGLNLDSNKWYDLKVYHNTENGYIRAEIHDIADNTTQLFEGGNVLVENRDLGRISFYGFLNSCEEETCVDYDDLSVTAVAAGNTQKAYELSDITLSKTEIGAGDVSASVDVTSYTDAQNITTSVAALITACYSSNGLLVDVDYVSITPRQATNTATVTVPEENASSYKVKAMIWNEAMQPLKEAKTLNW